MTAEEAQHENWQPLRIFYFQERATQPTHQISTVFHYVLSFLFLLYFNFALNYFIKAWKIASNLPELVVSGEGCGESVTSMKSGPCCASRQQESWSCCCSKRRRETRRAEGEGCLRYLWKWQQANKMAETQKNECLGWTWWWRLIWNWLVSRKDWEMAGWKDDYWSVQDSVWW